MRAIAEAAWEAGASLGRRELVDQLVKRELIEHAPEEALSHTPKWILQQLRAPRRRTRRRARPDRRREPGGARRPRPRPGRPRADARARRGDDKQVDEPEHRLDDRRLPERGLGDDGVRRARPRAALGGGGFAVRLDEPDPVEAWREHLDRLRTRASDSTGAASTRSASTARDRPDRRPHPGDLARRRHDDRLGSRRAEHADRGGLHHARPAPHRGRRALDAPARPARRGSSRGLELRFEGGRAVDVSAEENGEVVAAQIASDEGGSFLGEVALVDGGSRSAGPGSRSSTRSSTRTPPATSPTARASRRASQGAEGLEKEELRARGVNVDGAHRLHDRRARGGRRRRDRGRRHRADHPRRRLAALATLSAATTGFVSAPIPSISIVISSPGCRKTCGSRNDADAGRRAGRDQVARLERDRLRDERDHLGDAEDHVRGRGVLERLAVQDRPDRRAPAGRGSRRAGTSAARPGRTCRATCRASTGRPRTGGRARTRRSSRGSRARPRARSRPTTPRTRAPITTPSSAS